MVLVDSFLFLIALMGACSSTYLGDPQSRSVDQTIYRVSEIIIIIALSRVVSWFLFTDVIPSIAELRLFLQQPLEFFLSGGFLSTAVIALVAWWIASSTSQLFHSLDVSPEELHFTPLPVAAQNHG
ncbi:MAG: hypothetical protein R3C44_05525 [Chloroflexota bacterium]